MYFRSIWVALEWVYLHRISQYQEWISRALCVLLAGCRTDTWQTRTNKWHSYFHKRGEKIRPKQKGNSDLERETWQTNLKHERHIAARISPFFLFYLFIYFLKSDSPNYKTYFESSFRIPPQPFNNTLFINYIRTCTSCDKTKHTLQNALKISSERCAKTYIYF